VSSHKRLRIILVFALVHAIVSVAIFIVSFGRSMARFDTGDDPSVFEVLLSTLSEVLFFPLMHLLNLFEPAPRVFAGLFGYIPIIANSLLWGCVIWMMYTLVQNRLQHRAGG
jgi:hypothetical protein